MPTETSRRSVLKNTAVAAAAILPHAESEHGMFGMVTALIVK